MREVVAIRHLAHEDLGGFVPPLEAAGLRIRYLEAGRDDLSHLDSLEPALLVVLGGPVGVYQDRDFPFLADEVQLLTRRLAADRPTLGICLGSQLMARALGAQVYPGERGKEIGWAPLALTAAGFGGPLGHLDQTPVLHWHGDTFDLPAGAVHLATSERYPNQAFACGENGLALQFHPEVTVNGMESWFIGAVGEIAAEGLSVAGLRAETARFGPALEQHGQAFLSDWLHRVGLGA